jgi:hypothetical protein
MEQLAEEGEDEEEQEEEGGDGEGLLEGPTPQRPRRDRRESIRLGVKLS